MHWTRAQSIIRERGHFAHITLDDLLCVYGTVHGGRPGDAFTESMMVFPVPDGDQTVETAPIREWLGLSQAGVLLEGAAATA
jgi:hypothetical protein